MRVRDRMLREPTTVREEEELGVALQLMLWGGVRHLPVVDGYQLVGILSDRDVLRHRGEVGWGVQGRVRDAMTRDVETIGPDEPLEDAAARMATRHIDCLPVVDSGRVVGIVTTTDLVTLMARCELRRETPTVGAIMSPEPATARRDEYLLDAAARMFHRNFRHLPVVDERGQVVGILSDRDVRSAIGNPLGKLREEMLVEEAMTGGAWTIGPGAPLPDVVDMLLDDRVGAVPVVDQNGRLLGIVSYLDVLRATADEGATAPEVPLGLDVGRARPR